MDEKRTCPQCSRPLPSDTTQGLCPACLLKRGLETNTIDDSTDQAGPGHATWTPPTVEALAVSFPELDILELIGRGGMGAVYKARQKELDRLVALKILPPEIGSQDSLSKSFAQRFAREAQAMAKLNHPNIVTIHSFGSRSMAATPVCGMDVSSMRGDSQPFVEETARHGQDAQATQQLYFFLMEYVDGLSLRQLLDRGTINPKEALAIVPQICDALQYAHDRGIVHRDIKPENILLNRAGQVKIADFGLAKLIGRDAIGDATSDFGATPKRCVLGGANPDAANLADSAVTGATQRVMGTPQYMAPEQIAHPRDVDHRADIYSLGVVFYQMLTGELPRGKSGEKFAGIEGFEPPSRKVLIDVRLDEVVLRALEREPSRRYQQVSEVKTQVETIVTDMNAAAPPSGQTKKGTADIDATLESGKPRLGIVRRKKGIVLVGTRGGKPVVNWPGVIFVAIRILAISLLLILSFDYLTADRYHIASAGIAFGMGIFLAALAIRICFILRYVPPDQLVALDQPATADQPATTNVTPAQKVSGFRRVIPWAIFLSGFLWSFAWGYVLYLHNRPGVAVINCAGFVAIELLALILAIKTRRQVLGIVVTAIATLLIAGILAFFALVLAYPSAVVTILTPKGDTPTNQSAGYPWRTTLPSGVTVELVGVSEHPSDGKAWWKPDGSPLADRPYTNAGHRSYPSPDQSAYELSIRAECPAGKDFSEQWIITPSTGFAGGPSFDPKTGTVLSSIATSVPKSARSINVRYGVAIGPWTTVIETSGTGTESSSINDVSCSFSPAQESGDGVVITVAHNVKDRQARLLAITKAGKEITSSRCTSGAAGDVQQLTVTFSNLAMKDVACFRLQTRPYEWVEFKNVSLRPGQATAVEVVGGVPAGETPQRASQSSSQAAGPIGQKKPAAELNVVGSLLRDRKDSTKWQIEALVDEADILKVAAGQDVGFTLEALPRRVFKGKVIQVADEPTRLENLVCYKVVIQVEQIENSDAMFKPGMTAGVWFNPKEKSMNPASTQPASQPATSPATEQTSQVATVAQLRECHEAVDHFLTAWWNGDESLDDLSLGSAVGWLPDAETNIPPDIHSTIHIVAGLHRPSMRRLEIKARLPAVFSSKADMLSQCQTLAISGSLAAVKLDDPNEAEDNIIFFWKSSSGWRFLGVGGGPTAMSPDEALAKYDGQIKAIVRLAIECIQHPLQPTSQPTTSPASKLADGLN